MVYCRHSSLETERSSYIQGHPSHLVLINRLYDRYDFYHPIRHLMDVYGPFELSTPHYGHFFHILRHFFTDRLDCPTGHPIRDDIDVHQRIEINGIH